MKFLNSWASFNKQFDKIDITVRISFLTIFELKIDKGKRDYRFIILNIGLQNDKSRRRNK